MKIQIIDSRHPLLADVILLGKKNAKTLGMFPDGAFMDHALRKTIFAAIENDQLMGYILFRITQSKRIICIAHLCVHEHYRKKGVGKFLLNSVCKEYQRLYRGISLSCRKDYLEASAFYEAFGFKAMKTIRSRSKEEHYLTKWWYDFGNADLFSDIMLTSTKVNALLDANIIIKLSDERCNENQEAIALIADWLVEEADYFYAPEVFNEIHRDENIERAAATRSFVHSLQMARITPVKTDEIHSKLNSIFPGKSQNTVSDKKQLAECIAAEIDYFVTLDAPLLDRTDEIYELFGVKILRPADFILYIDHNIRGRDYRSLRVAGARHEYADIRQEELETLIANKWLNMESGEKKHILRQRLTTVIADIKNAVFRLVKDKEENCIGYFAAIIGDRELKVSVLRTIKARIADLLFQQLIRDIIMLAVDKKCEIVKIQEEYITEERLLILSGFGFEYSNAFWVKLIVHSQGDSVVCCSSPSLKPYWDTKAIIDRISNLKGIDQDLYKLHIEKKLWPAKFTDIDVPTYIVPIRPYWAGQLFDHYIANHNLFGSKEEVSWRKENVYYRSVRPVSELAPGRILWYISTEADPVTGRDKKIVATSYLEEVHIGPAKMLFQKFKNYGIYEWKDIAALTGNNAMKEIKALKFADTEVFKIGIPLGQINDVMNKFGRPANTFASPVQVSGAIFNELYRVGKV